MAINNKRKTELVPIKPLKTILTPIEEPTMGISHAPTRSMRGISGTWAPETWLQTLKKGVLAAKPSWKMAWGGALQQYQESVPYTPLDAFDEFLKSGVSKKTLSAASKSLLSIQGVPFRKPREQKTQLVKLSEAKFGKGVEVYEEAMKERRALYPENIESGSMKHYAFMATSTVMDNLVLYGPALLFKSPALLISSFGAKAQATAYGEHRAAGETVEQSSVAAFSKGLAESIPELIPFAVYTKTGISFLKRLALAQLAELGQEEITEAVTLAIDKLTIDPNMTIRDAINRMIETGIVTMISTPVLTGVSHAAMRVREEGLAPLRDEAGLFMPAKLLPGGETEAIGQFSPRFTAEQIEQYGVPAPRVEIDDSQAQLLIGFEHMEGTKKLGSILVHPELHKVVKGWKNIKVKFDSRTNYYAAYQQENRILVVNPLLIQRDNKNPLASILHELQHDIQRQYDLAKGTDILGAINKEAFPKYFAAKKRWTKFVDTDTFVEFKERIKDLGRPVSSISLYRTNEAMEIAAEIMPARMFTEYKKFAFEYRRMPSQLEAYHYTFGEVEARAPGERMKLSPEERMRKQPYKIPPEKWNIRGDGSAKSLETAGKVTPGYGRDAFRKAVEYLEVGHGLSRTLALERAEGFLARIWTPEKGAFEKFVEAYHVEYAEGKLFVKEDVPLTTTEQAALAGVRETHVEEFKAIIDAFPDSQHARRITEGKSKLPTTDASALRAIDEFIRDNVVNPTHIANILAAKASKKHARGHLKEAIQHMTRAEETVRLIGEVGGVKTQQLLVSRGMPSLGVAWSRIRLAEDKISRGRPLVSRALDAVRGEEGAIVIGETPMLKDDPSLREIKQPPDILPGMPEWLMSPEMALRNHPGAQLLVGQLIEAKQRAGARVEEDDAIFGEIRGNLNKQERIQATALARAPETIETSTAPNKVKTAAHQILIYFDEVMREEAKSYKRKMYEKYLPAKMHEAFELVLIGEDLKVIAKDKGIDVDALQDVMDAYREIDNWGLDNYVTNMERGTYRFVNEAGSTVLVGVTKKDAIHKAQRYLAENRNVKTLWLDTSFAGGREMPTQLSRGQYFRMERSLAKAYKQDITSIREALHKGGAIVTVKPTLKFAGPMQKRLGKLKGETDIFKVLPAYSYAMRNKFELDPVLYDIRQQAAGFPPNVRDLVLGKVRQAKGEKTAGDKLLDSVFDELGLGRKPFAYSRSVAGFRKWAAWRKLGYRPVAGLINFAAGQGHVFVKTGNKYMAKAIMQLRTKEGKQLIMNEAPYMGTSFAQEAGKLKGKLPKYHPLYTFQWPEPINREMAYMANYLAAKEEFGLDETAARLHARRSVRFQQFTYDVLSLPRIMGGPTGQLFFQFKAYFVKEIEFISTLRGVEIPRYIAMQWALAGPRGLIYTLKTIPILGALGILDDAEEWLTKNLPRFSRGVAGYIGRGYDITAAATFQFPQKGIEWFGPTMSDIYSIWKNIIEPLAQGVGHMGPTGIRVMRDTVVAFYYWNMLVESIVDDDGWVKNRQGQRIYQVKDNWDRLGFIFGTKPRAMAEERLVEQEAIREEKIERRTRSNIVDKISVHLIAKEPLPPELIRDALETGVIRPRIDARGRMTGWDFTSIERDLKNRLISPKERLLNKITLKNRMKVLEMYPYRTRAKAPQRLPAPRQRKIVLTPTKEE